MLRFTADTHQESDLRPTKGCDKHMKKQKKKPIKMIKQDFRRLFMNPPGSEKELFENIKQDISMADPSWYSHCEPAPREDIWRLENALLKRFGQGIPSSYRTYLELMGEDDGGLVSCHIDDLEFWNYFKRKKNMAWGAVYHIERIDEQIAKSGRIAQRSTPMPPFWNFYYTIYAGIGWGFFQSETGYLEREPDQIVQVYGTDKFYFSHDSFSRFLFYCTYNVIAEQIWDHGTAFTHSINELPDEYQNMHSVWFYAVCPIEWDTPGYTPLVNFLQEVEHACSIDECWFSSQKDFNLFDIYDNIHIGQYEFARYIGCHSAANLTVSVCFETSPGDRPEIQVRIISQDVHCTKQLVDEISKQTILIEKSLTIRCID